MHLHYIYMILTLDGQIVNKPNLFIFFFSFFSFFSFLLPVFFSSSRASLFLFFFTSERTGGLVIGIDGSSKGRWREARVRLGSAARRRRWYRGQRWKRGSRWCPKRTREGSVARLRWEPAEDLIGFAGLDLGSQQRRGRIRWGRDDVNELEVKWIWCKWWLRFTAEGRGDCVAGDDGNQRLDRRSREASVLPGFQVDRARQWCCWLGSGQIVDREEERRTERDERD